MNEIDTMRIQEHTRVLKEAAELALQTPEIQSPVPRRYWPEVDDYTMSAGFTRTPGGRIFLSWFGIEDAAGTAMLVTCSDDEGETWREPQYLLDPGFTRDHIHISILVGNLWTDPQGRVWWFFNQSIGYFDGRAGSWAVVCDNPDAANPVWGKPFRIWHGASLNKPTVTSSGEWMLPVSLWNRNLISASRKFPHGTVESSLYAELDEFRGANVLSSKDQGKTWERLGMQRTTDQLFDENMVMEMRDGKLKMYARDVFGIVSCISGDGGLTWSPFKREWVASTARFFVRALPSGKWLMVRLNSTGVRSHLTAYLSDNDGESWYGGLELDPREHVSYPDGFIHPDGRIFIQYDRLRDHGEILLAVFTEEDVATGKDVSGKVVLQKPILQSYSCRKSV